jgi:predicted nucleic acid-binding protein
MAGAEPLFLDTSGLVAILVADDAHHQAAARQFQTLGSGGRILITTDWVLAEDAANVLLRILARFNLPHALHWELLTDPSTAHEQERNKNKG